MNGEISLMIVADHIFDSISDETYQGYLSISGNAIRKVGRGLPDEQEVQSAAKVLRFTNELVMPGITDCHTFFTGYAVYHVGADISGVADDEQGLYVLARYAENRPVDSPILGHGWNPGMWDMKAAESVLNQHYPNRAVVLFAADRGSCIMNDRARALYQFTPETCWPESYYRVMRDYLNDRSFIDGELRDYMGMLNAKGVTTVKEMGFDDFYGFTEILKEKETDRDFNLRFVFMSQPVGAGMNLPYARRMREKFTGDKIRFSGFNLMTDGTIAAYKGDLKEPYEGKDFTCSIPVDYEQIEKDVLAADAEGFRYSLHCQGDGAVAKVASIYEKCQMEGGKLKNRHALTDMEFSDSEDIDRLGKIGACAELYFQIMSLDPGEVVLENIRNTIGNERGKNYWNRRRMADAGMILGGATDLPLMITDVPSSIYYSCGGHLEGGQVFQPENTITVPELLKAWTIGGQTNIGFHDRLGTLEAGKYADIAVFDRDLTNVSIEECSNAEVVMTVMDGNVVYQRSERR